ncbi:hypothetical protein [Candidatus Cyanaurora vandensis]|uniref:hypothetical protein n=1 Tax=Candidatus Cyanaurora vandensis TaxID=2714958 RepID=UPI002579F9E1|nr:hypothetical protein [Candidatus Cyanaurora vandensis]
MSVVFREFVKKIGSGRLTGRDLTREEACRATVMLLNQEATPAQMGAFLIAHRIKRPTALELAGILDAFDLLARPFTPPADSPAPLVLSSPYDGQERLGIVTPLSALICSSLGQGIVLHGSHDMPPKHGLTSFDILASLGVDLMRDRATLADQYRATGLGWVYLPAHFPEAYHLQTLRAELGKRPPLATAELLWNPVKAGFPVMGYTHRETITFAIATAELRGMPAFAMVRGVQGSVNCTLFHPNLGCRWAQGMTTPQEFRLLAADYGWADDDYALVGDGQDLIRHRDLTLATLRGEPTPLRRAAIFSSAFLLTQAGFSPSIVSALPLVVQALDEGLAHRQLEKLC